ncbi:MAG: hypothetical protein RIA62_16195 [Cyclobacteriaceae bacterium]
MNWLSRYREDFLQNWFGIDGRLLFISLCLIYVVLYFLKRMLIIDNIAAFEILQERGEMWVFDLFFGLTYISVPIFLAWKFAFTTFTLWVGCFMFGYRITFDQLWKLIMIGELIFIVAEIFKIGWFTIIPQDLNYQDYQAFYPLSVMNLVDYTQVSTQWHYPLKSLNLFELVYWCLLIVGVYWISGKRLKISFYVVTSSYVFLFFFWLAYYVLAYRS